jgi:hypothetical protein
MNQMETKTNAGELATATDITAWGGGQEITSKDIMIPKILPLQFMSEKVKNGEGKYGEFRDTLSNRLFGDLDTPFVVIPFYLEKKWYEFEVVQNKAGARKREFSRVVNITAENDDLPYVDSNGTIERDRCMDFYVLIPSEVAEGIAMPYVLSFRRTSLKAGKQLATQFLANARAGKVPAAVAMQITGKSVQNDLGEFVVAQASPARMSTNEEIIEAKKWYDLIKMGQTKLDDSDVIAEEQAEKVVSKEDSRF